MLSEFNKLFEKELGTSMFRFVGSRNSPFVQRNLKYTIRDEQIVSCQMLLIDLDCENDIFQDCVVEIKKNIISKFKPTVKKIKASDDTKKIKSVDLNNFNI